MQSVVWQVRVWSRTLTNAQKLVQELQNHSSATKGVSFKVCSTAEEAVRDADIICTTTFATTPILHAKWVKPGAHINGTYTFTCYDIYLLHEKWSWDVLCT